MINLKNRETAEIFLHALSDQSATKIAESLTKIIGEKNKAVVVSSSMAPTLKPGDIVTIEVVPQKTRSGSVVVFVKENMQVIHRVLFVRNGMVQTKGDRSKGWDTPFPLKDLIGVVPGLHSRKMVVISIVRGLYLRLRNLLGILYRKVSNRHIKDVEK